MQKKLIHKLKYRKKLHTHKKSQFHLLAHYKEDFLVKKKILPLETAFSHEPSRTSKSDK